MQNKLISIIMPTYNRERTICRAIDSVLLQTYSDWELIIIDDASIDSTKKIIDRYNDSRIFYYRNDDNKGPSVSRNIGIELAKGSYITFLDSDCAYKVDKLEKQLEEIQRGYEAVYCPFEYYAGNECKVIPMDEEVFGESNLLEVLKVKNVVDTSTILANHDFIKQIGMFDEEFPALEDYELAIRMAKEGKVGVVKEPLVENYFSSVSITTNEERILRAFLLLFLKHNDLWKDSILKQKYLNVLRECINGRRGLNAVFIFEDFINSRLVSHFPELACELNRMIVKLYHEEVTLFAMLKAENRNIIKKKIQNDFIIYGAGKRAGDIYGKLNDLEKKNVKYYVVTDKQTEAGRIGEKEILSVEEMCSRDESRDTFILLAMNRANAMEAIQTLECVGYTNYLYCDDY